MARPHPALVELAACRPLPPVEDPREVVRSAYEHRMDGLLFSAVMEDGAWPADLVRGLAQGDLRTRAHHQRLRTVLADVTSRLRTAGVEVATAKGVTTEQRWYDRTGERPCNDVDLLTEPGTSMRDVVDVLQPGHPRGREWGELADAGVLQSVDLVVDGVDLDVHADILKVEVRTRGAEELWRRTELLDDGVRVLDPETALVHMLLHLTKDRFARLLGYADVARLLAHEELDYDHIAAFSRREGFDVHVNAALHAVTDELGLPPAPVPRPRGLTASLHRQLWGPQTRLLGKEGFIDKQHRHLWVSMTMRGRRVEALSWWLRRRVVPPRQLIDIYHPDTAGPYLWRLVVGRTRRQAERRAHLREVTARR